MIKQNSPSTNEFKERKQSFCFDSESYKSSKPVNTDEGSQDGSPGLRWRNKFSQQFLNVSTLTAKEHRISPYVPADEQMEWIKSIVAVTFDIDEGQVIEDIQPPSIFCEKDLKTISLLSFPDSNSFLGAEGHCKYVFRITINDEAEDNGGGLFGYTMFYQRKDPTNPRGYFQKSLVIMTDKLYVGFFKSVVEVVGLAYFKIANASERKEFLLKCYSAIKEWKKAVPGTKQDLELLDQTLSIIVPRAKTVFHHTLNPTKLRSLFNETTEDCQVKLPDIDLKRTKTYPENDPKSQDKVTEQLINNESSFGAKCCEDRNQNECQTLSDILTRLSVQERGILQDINIFSHIQADKIHVLWKLWELVLTNQPLLIITDQPGRCSELVLGLISLISPIEYIGNYRPYLTVYDPSSKAIQDSYDQKTLENVIIGSTNPLFLKLLKNFPNVLRLDSDYEYTVKSKQKTANRKWLVTSEELNIEGDTSITQKLLQTKSEESNAINNTFIRKQFRDLTNSFLHSFAEYFAEQKNDIKRFDEKEFMKFIDKKKFDFRYLFASSSKIAKLYLRFLRTRNFFNFLKSCQNVYYVKQSINK